MNSIIIRPVITEKSMREAAFGKFSFEVLKSANKAEIAEAVAKTFNVKPTAVQTMVVPSRQKRTYKSRKTSTLSSWKKAIVTLQKGQTIDLFDITEEAVNAAK